MRVECVRERPVHLIVNQVPDRRLRWIPLAQHVPAVWVVVVLSWEQNSRKKGSPTGRVDDADVAHGHALHD